MTTQETIRYRVFGEKTDGHYFHGGDLTILRVEATSEAHASQLAIERGVNPINVTAPNDALISEMPEKRLFVGTRF